MTPQPDPSRHPRDNASPSRLEAQTSTDGTRTSPLLRPPRAITRTIHTRPSAIQGTLALQWSLPGDVDAVPVPPADLRLVSREAALDDIDPAVAAVATSRAALPDPGPWTAQLVQAVLEVLAHERPRHQLARWLAPEVYADLGIHLAASPPRSPARPGTGGRARRTVSSTHVFEPADGVVEATAVVVGGRRARAVAVRLEGWDGRWRCTKLAVL
jgi:hypothetical protein